MALVSLLELHTTCFSAALGILSAHETGLDSRTSHSAIVEIRSLRVLNVVVGRPYTCWPEFTSSLVVLSAYLVASHCILGGEAGRAGGGAGSSAKCTRFS